MKYRIVEKYDLPTGDIKFFPEFRKFWIWFSFVDMTMFPTVIKYDSYESARKFVEKQIKKPSPRYYYITEK